MLVAVPLFAMRWARTSQSSLDCELERSCHATSQEKLSLPSATWLTVTASWSWSAVAAMGNGVPSVP
jgi:hypothetical protein